MAAWREFKRGKRRKLDVQQFERNLEDNLFQLRHELVQQRYINSSYVSFYVNDPKLRHIHKACVRDRVVHQALYRVLSPVFDQGFIYDSYSCRLGKGNHTAVERLELFLRRFNYNLGPPVYALKCDVRKFFDSIDQKILFNLLQKRMADEKTIWLVKGIIESFSSRPDKGLPLGNVTSQLFANVYLNELDQFVKHELRVKYYLRYCDDFIIVSNSLEYLKALLPHLKGFLTRHLKLELHSKKIICRKYEQGIDFLGYVCLPHYRVLRTKTKRRIFSKLQQKQSEVQQGLISSASLNQSVRSYLGVVKHCNGFKIARQIKELTGS